MNIFIDTNILSYAYSGKLKDLKIEGQKITSINALEFLNNIEKLHTNRAKFYIPLTSSLIKYHQIIEAKDFFKKRNRPLNKRLSDQMIFNFSNDFSDYVLYNNESITQVINSRYKDIFNISISFLPKTEFKNIKSKFSFIIENDLECEKISDSDIMMAYDLLDKFIQNHSLKIDFRNCWNDILILSKSINNGAKLITTDKLLNRFASEIYNGKINKENDILEIVFPNKNRKIKINNNRESKGYINRGWSYKVRNDFQN